MSAGVTGVDKLRRRLALIGAQPDERIDIGEAALTLASFDHPGVGLERYRDHLAELARDTAAAAVGLGGAGAGHCRHTPLSG